MSRMQVIAWAPCPYCHVPAGEPCQRWRGGVRVSQHRERWQIAQWFYCK